MATYPSVIRNGQKDPKIPSPYPVCDRVQIASHERVQRPEDCSAHSAAYPEEEHTRQSLALLCVFGTLLSGPKGIGHP